MEYETIEKRKEVNLLEYWQVITKRKWVIMVFAVVVTLSVGIKTFNTVPVYKATTTLLIEEEASKVLSIEDEFGYRRQMTDLRFFNTQIKLLTSKSLAERVARKMNLPARPELSTDQKPKKSLITAAKNLISFKWIKLKKKSKSSNPGNSNPLIPLNPYSRMARAVQSSIEVSPVRETKLVEVSYRSIYPVLCADIVNTLVEEFIDFSVEKRYETTQQASDFLSEEIDNLREDLAAKERELQRYGQEKKLFFLSDKESATISKFADLTRAYTKSQIDCVKAEASYRELKELDVDSQPQFVRNPMIQILKTEYTRMRNEYREKGEIYKSDYPVMVTLRTKLDSMKSELGIEITKAVDEAERAYRSAQKEKASLKNMLEAHKADVIRMNSNAILYNSIKIEVENKRNLLNSLVARQNETLVSARLSGLKTSNVSIIDRAEVPKSPVSPNKKRNIFLAIIVGLFGGMGICFFLEYLDNTVKGPEEVEKMTGLPSLGVIPYLPPEGMKKKKRYGYYSNYKYEYSYSEKKDNPGSEQKLPDIKKIELVNHIHPKFFISEDYRTVRTSILLSHAKRPPKTIAFTSALPMEGKTSSAANIAVAFSQLEKKVLLVDSDMRKPRLHRIFKVRNVGGLSGYLTGKSSLEKAVQKTNVKNIWLIPSGPIPPNPAELLNSGKMKGLIERLQKRFDIVLLDTPPVLAVVDAVITSSFIDSTVFVVQAGKTTRKSFLQAVEEMKKAKGKIIGVLFNEVKARGDGYHSPYYEYSRYRYQYYEEKEESKAH